MKLYFSSLSFNLQIADGGGTPAWGTELGQGAEYRFSDGLQDFLTAMLYKSIPNLEEVFCPLGKGGNHREDYDFIVASIFDKVFVNGERVDGAKMLLLIVRKKNGDFHVGRCTLKYNPRMSYYKEEINKKCYELIAKKLGIDSKEGSWFVDEIHTENQDELHLTAYVGGNNPIIFPNKEERYQFYYDRINECLPRNESKHLTRAQVSSSLQTIYFGTPGSGKSHRVKDIIDEKVPEGEREHRVFRTTFHPDSDYASFVGCYKPTTHQGLGRKPLSKAELVAKFIQYKRTNKGYVLHRFCATHPEFGDLSRAEKEAFLVAVNEPSTNYAEILKAVACAKEVSKSMQRSDITYEFIPQVFTNAYVQAWKKQAEAIEQEKKQAEDVYLVIEEINRGNCAQIFGDLFQILDRDKDGVSEYGITPDVDLLAYLKSQLPKDSQGLFEDKLRLPANLHILATMNTSDQSLFPMDSAFKRRWDWEYVPIDYSKDLDSGQFLITIDKKEYLWVDFLQKVNARILSATDSEDKQMGNFFIKHSVEEKDFKSKVMFYLWHEVCKDEYHTKNNFFRTLENQEEIEFSFNQLHEENGTSLLVGFMQYLGVTPLEEMPPQEGDGTPNDAE